MKFQALNFKCPNCGAPTKFSPAFGKLKCDFCGSTFPIEKSVEEIIEFDYNVALEKLDINHKELHEKEVKCTNCGSSFDISPYSISTLCPSCGTPAIPLSQEHYFIAINAKSHGPYEMKRIEALIADGTVIGDTLVWTEGMPQWQKAITVLSKYFPETPPAL